MKPCIITDQITQNLAIASKTIRDHGLHLVELHGIEGKSVEEFLNPRSGKAAAEAMLERRALLFFVDAGAMSASPSLPNPTPLP